MEFQDVVRRRRMIRSYAERPVDPGVVRRLVSNAVRAPNAGFSQGWEFLVLDDPADLDRFWASTTPPDSPPAGRWLSGMRTAPVVIVPMSDREAYVDRYAEPDKATPSEEAAADLWPVPYWHVDTGMAALLILQTAVDEGLGACFFGIPGPRVEPFRAAFGVPTRVTPVGAITVGHRTADSGVPGSPTRRARRPLDEVMHHGRW